MKVIYAYCPDCGMEWLDKIFLQIIGNSNRGLVLQCPECNGRIHPNNYDAEEENNDSHASGG